MQDAKAKADQIAKISGVTLGKPTFVSDNSNTPIISAPQPYPSAAVGSGAVPPTAISAGQIDITLSVQVSYAIQ